MMLPNTYQARAVNRKKHPRRKSYLIRFYVQPARLSGLISIYSSDDGTSG
jgi:hypothetical protein